MSFEAVFAYRGIPFLRRVLPQKILSRISFPSGAELLEQFPPDFLLEGLSILAFT